MQTRTIGRTDLAVTEFGFGTAPLGGLYRACPRDVAMATLETAWQGGLRYYDTAPWYGFGLAERYVGDFLRDKPKGSYVLSTKVGRIMQPAEGDTVPNMASSIRCPSAHATTTAMTASCAASS